MKCLLLLLAAVSITPADGPGLIISRRAASDSPLTADPDSPFWKGVPGVIADQGPRGEPAPGHRTEIRSRWTSENLYFLFISSYEQLHVFFHPRQTTETNKLWDHDVAEVFVGWDFEHIRRYKEFEMSPQGEWVDLDIDRDHSLPEGGWRWNSGFQVKARIDPAAKVWYGEMRIPIKSIDNRTPQPGLEMRVNLYRCQGAPPKRVYIAWQPTGAASFHVPEAFGRLKLGE